LLEEQSGKQEAQKRKNDNARSSDAKLKGVREKSTDKSKLGAAL